MLLYLKHMSTSAQQSSKRAEQGVFEQSLKQQIFIPHIHYSCFDYINVNSILYNKIMIITPIKTEIFKPLFDPMDLIKYITLLLLKQLLQLAQRSFH